ncbi:MAG: hypothetical protein Q9167_001869 [Letrouitia subvulpina]
MSTTTSSVPVIPTDVNGFLNAGAGKGVSSEGQSLGSFLASLSTGLVIFGIELAVFLLIKNKLIRIYRPRTYLVPPRERTKAPPEGLWHWIAAIFRTSNSEFISKCGLDAYFFLRYLRMLLKIFVPLALLLLSVLIPVNVVGGRGGDFAVGVYGHNKTAYSNVTGLDLLAWGNVRPEHNNRYWAHLVLAVVVVLYTCAICFDELRGYIRLRQSYLTSPQHRLRASATTVLVNAIPRKWCTREALDGLYDVYPGGIRNIWINRNFDELSEKVRRRDTLALRLESAETELIRKVKQVHLAKVKKEAKKADSKGQNEEGDQKRMDGNRAALAMGGGFSSGDPHQVRHTIDEALEDSSSELSESISREKGLERPVVPVPVLGQAIEAVGQGIDHLGRTVFRGIKQAGKDVDSRLTTTGGFVPTQSGQVVTENGSFDNAFVASQSADEKPTDAKLPSNPRRVNPGRSFGQSLSPGETSASLSSRERQSGQQNLCVQADRTSDDRHQSSLDPRVDGSASLHVWQQSGKEPSNLNDTSHSQSRFWRKGRSNPLGVPSPTPQGQEKDEFPLGDPTPVVPGRSPQAVVNRHSPEEDVPAQKSVWTRRIPFLGLSSNPPKASKAERYPEAYDENFNPEEDGEPAWKKYITKKDRDTMRLPIFGWQWMPSLPLIGKKVDTIYYCRKEVARLNVEIEEDQKNPEKFPLMNSAFVQFNHQVAAHMACQTVSHHIPQHMAPRVVEISPDDVIWENMTLKWWVNYIRTGLVICLIVVLIFFWGVPVFFAGVTAQLDSFAGSTSWLHWYKTAPATVKAIVQGLLPQGIMAILLILVPIMLRLLARTQGDSTGMIVELSVQSYYFAFLFIQLFLVVTLGSGIGATVQQIRDNPAQVPAILASNLPKSSNFFFSYMLLQALSVSGGALVQLVSLFRWFILGSFSDSTGRQKWQRQTKLPDVNWGAFFPVYTNLACIGLIYSIVSPLIMLFNIVTFSLFWLVYRYNTLYVTKFRFDTGGLLFPRAINQLFVGLYVMELCLIGLFSLVRDAHGGQPFGSPCKVQAIIMGVVFFLTIVYQWLLNNSFSPLYRYLPITLEDEAVIRDEQFAKEQEHRWRLADGERDGDDINDLLEERERRSLEESRKAEEIELKQIQAQKEGHNFGLSNIDGLVPDAITKMIPKRGAWAEKSRQRANTRESNRVERRHHRSQNATDVEALTSGTRIGDALFSGFHDELEDLTPDERDKLVQRAFQHSALRARRPVIWIPRDEFGVSDDEIYRTQRFSTHIWISNEFIGLDEKCKVIYRKSPPDFSEIDLMEL